MHKALDRVRQMLEEGADIIDIGACSTRPGSQAVGAEEEWRRLGPFLQEVRKHFGEIRISVDTYWASVVEKAYDTIGPFIVNDISAGEDDPQMLPAVGRLGLEYVAMHKRGNPQTMQSLCQYEDVVEDVLEYFRKFGERAEQYGIRNWILDPGFGFAKTIEQNYQLLAHLSGPLLRPGTARTCRCIPQKHDLPPAGHHPRRSPTPDTGTALRST